MDTVSTGALLWVLLVAGLTVELNYSQQSSEQLPLARTDIANLESCTDEAGPAAAKAQRTCSQGSRLLLTLFS